jgi:hypothetical protein
MSRLDAFQQLLREQLPNHRWEVLGRAWVPSGWNGEQARGWALGSLLPPVAPVTLVFRDFRPARGAGWLTVSLRGGPLGGGWGGDLTVCEASSPGPVEAQAVFTALDRHRQEAASPGARAEEDRALFTALVEPQPEGAAHPGEVRWLAATNPDELLRSSCLRERKQRLFACAVCRRLPEVQADAGALRAVEAAECYADGRVVKKEMRKARKASCLHWLSSFEAEEEAILALWRARGVLAPAAYAELCDLLRDLTGSPHRPAVSVRAAWLRSNGGAARALAEAIYEQGCFEEMPVLADALEDAGCASEELLAHLRGPGEHARGCWALDRLLGIG